MEALFNPESADFLEYSKLVPFLALAFFFFWVPLQFYY